VPRKANDDSVIWVAILKFLKRSFNARACCILVGEERGGTTKCVRKESFQSDGVTARAAQPIDVRRCVTINTNEQPAKTHSPIKPPYVGADDLAPHHILINQTGLPTSVAKRVGAEEQVAQRLAHPVGEPALAPVLLPVMQDVAPLAERLEVRRFVVARVVV